jgi:ParB-like chromosome segregation protein Spo0J
LAETMLNVIETWDAKRQEKSNQRSLTINAVAKRLNRAHATITKLVQNGTLKTTKDGRVPETELIRFLENE